MVNHLNKHINQLSWDTVKNIERVEHSLPSAPTKKQFQLLESQEHGISPKTSMRKLLKIETKEHVKPEEDEEEDEEEDDDDDKKSSPYGPASNTLGALIVKTSKR